MYLNVTKSFTDFKMYTCKYLYFFYLSYNLPSEVMFLLLITSAKSSAI
jgi:hypothetical protein